MMISHFDKYERLFFSGGKAKMFRPSREQFEKLYKVKHSLVIINTKEDFSTNFQGLSLYNLVQPKFFLLLLLLLLLLNLPFLCFRLVQFLGRVVLGLCTRG